MKRIQQTIILTGVVIALVGFGGHFLVPGTSRSGLMIQVDSDETATRVIDLDLTESEYFFGIELLPPGQISNSNVTAYLLDSINYNLYTTGTPLSSVDALLTVEDLSRTQYNTTVTNELELYVVIQNNGTEPTYWNYYYAILPSSFYPTLTIGFTGVFIILVDLGWIMRGWKRYFVAGLSVNAALFLIRILTLSTYSLGLPDIFWDLIHTEMYNDYQYFYLAWVPNMVAGAWPYSDALYYYIYPPLWIYSVSIFGSTPSWLPGLVLFAFNIAAGPLVYMITLRLTEDQKRAIIAMLIYLLNPFTLIYGSFMWLNPTPFVFFITLSFYFAQKEQETYSVISMAFATLYKQYAVVLFPILVILFIKHKKTPEMAMKFKGFIRHTLLFIMVLGIVSLPFLIVDPMYYLNSMIFWNTGSYERLTYFIPDSWMPVHANTFFLWLGFPSWFTDAIAFLLINYVFLIICGIVVYGTYSMIKSSVDTLDKDAEGYRHLFVHALIWSFIAILCVQIFYPRGAYKFYLLALAPFFSILFDYDMFTERMNIPFKFQRKHLFHIIMAWTVFLFYRFAYFWILGIWMAVVLWKSGDLKRIQNNLVTILTLRFIRKSEPLELDELEEIYSE
ncbi:MAG: hypothetical protein ACFFF4_00285 [Candidatus Thorarchaeota archaeon]